MSTEQIAEAEQDVRLADAVVPPNERQIGDHVIDEVSFDTFLDFEQDAERRRLQPEDIGDTDGDTEVAFSAPGDAPELLTDQAVDALVVPARLGTVAKPAESLFKPSAAQETARRTYLGIQRRTSKPLALREQLSQDTQRLSPDYYSVYDISPQPDAGLGMVAMASAYVSREHKKAQSDRVTSDKTVVWAYSHHGMDVRDFFASIDELDDEEHTVRQHTRVVLAYDSDTQWKAIQASKILDGWDVTPQKVDPKEPQTFTLPENTGVALMPDTLDKLSAYQVLQGAKNKKILERAERTQIAENEPLIDVSPHNGRATATPPGVLWEHRTAEGPDRFQIMPQLDGKLATPVSKAVPLEETSLKILERSTTEFVMRQATHLREAGVVFNYVPELEAIVRRVTKGVRTDGLVYISGLLRNQAFVHPDELSRSQGPVVSHVLEAGSIEHAVLAADKQASIEPLYRDGGEHGYMLIDRATDREALGSSASDFKQAFEVQTVVEGDISQRFTQLNKTRQELMAEKAEGKRTELAGHVRKQFIDLIELYPQAGRDPMLALTIARELNNLNQTSLSSLAKEFALDAEKAGPLLSGPLVEVARADAADNHPLEALKTTLARAYKLSPRNPAIHETVMNILDADENLKKDRLPSYVNAASDYLRFGHNLGHDKIIETLESISLALKQDYEETPADNQTFKTIIVQNIETGAVRKLTLSVKTMKQIIAADSALANAEVAGTIRAYEDGYNEDIRDAQERLFTIWQSVVPRDAEELPKPRDEWDDQPPNREERWIYNGSLYQSDEAFIQNNEKAKSSEALFDEMAREYAKHSAVELYDYLARPNRTRDEQDIQMFVGNKLDEHNNPIPRTEVPIFKDSLPGHMIITGRTRMGKTTLLETMFEQLEPMNVNFWAFDLGDKSELGSIAENLTAKGRPVVVIRPGDKEAIPVSIDFLTPVEGCTTEEHIGKVVDAWITAYGGGGDSPVAHILAESLWEIYAANGWKVMPIEDLFASFGWDSTLVQDKDQPEVIASQPTTPGLQEFMDTCIKNSSDYGKNTNAGNLPVYFKNRIKTMQKGDFGEFLVGENAIDWEKLIDCDVVFDFSHITSHDQRRFLFTALTMQASSYLQFHKGLSKETKMVWAIDEASLIAKDAGDSELSRKHGVEAFAEKQKVLGGYGVSIWNAMQSTEGVHPDLLSQTSTRISLPLGGADIKTFLEKVDVEEGTPLYRRFRKALASGVPGTAIVWSSGMDEPELIKVFKSDDPEVDALSRARQQRIRPPIKPNPYDSFTAAQREEAMRIAQTSRQAWKQLFVGAITMAHVAHTDLPRRVPQPLQRQWKKDKTRDPEFARLVIYNIAKQAVLERGTAVKKAYPSRDLIASVVAHTISLLNEQPTARQVSPNFGLLPVREAQTYRKLTRPYYGRAPRAQQYAMPLPYRLPTPVETISESDFLESESPQAPADYVEVEEQIAALERHHLSPAAYQVGAVNAEAAYIGIIGVGNGRRIWKSLRLATGGERDQVTQRRLLAAALGYLTSSFSPRVSEVEEELSLPSYLHQRQHALAA